MGFYKNLIVLNDAERGPGHTVGTLKLMTAGNALQLKVSLNLEDCRKGGYYLAVADADGCIRDFPLGASGKLTKTMEVKSEFNLSRELACCVAEADRGILKVRCLGGTGGDSRFSFLFTEFFQTRAYYLPEPQPYRGIPKNIEIIGMMEPSKPGGAPRKEPSQPSGTAEKSAPEKKRQEPCETDLEKEPVTGDLPRPVNDEDGKFVSGDDRILQEDTTISDLLQNEGEVAECENYYDEDYENKLRVRKAKKFYQEFRPTAVNYDTYRVRGGAAGILSRKTEEKVEAIEKLLEETDSERMKTFYQTVEEQLNKLFRDYSNEAYLEKIISDSRWAKVEYGGGEESFYTVGVIYDGGAPAYICYGIPGEYSEVPPKELEGYCEWLPKDLEAPEAKGYWMMYQDAKTGESVDVGIR